MQHFFRKKSNVIILVSIIIAIILIPIIITTSKLGRVKDNEFQDGSKIQFNTVTDIQKDNLFKLAKVWGFVKYRHPAITSGSINIDAELFRIMPSLLTATDTTTATNLILKWLEKFPVKISPLNDSTLQNKTENIALNADLLWLKDTELLGIDLSNYLIELSKIMVMDSKNGYANFPNNDEYVSMTAENQYPKMKYDDTGLRLLGLFRYWNIVEYFYPYKDIMNEDWNKVLKDMIPEFIATKGKQSYVLSIAKLTTYIHDSHAYVDDADRNVFKYFGEKTPPIEFVNVDGEIVVSAVLNDDKTTLKLGDIITSMDNISINERIDNCKKYISLSNDKRFALQFRYRLLATQNDTAVIEVIRDDKKLSLTVNCYAKKTLLSGENPSALIENGRIGYINPAKLSAGKLKMLMTEYSNTDGIIVDLRNYPSEFIAYTLAEYIIPKSVTFAKYGHCNKLIPGEFTMVDPVFSGQNGTDVKPQYKNKVVILMDETSMSQSEFTIMSLRNAPNAVVIGDNSIGADGNVVVFQLPGQVETRMTGLSIFYPDGTPTQRVGLKPDIFVKKTVSGIKLGKDELLDKAISIILQ